MRMVAGDSMNVLTWNAQASKDEIFMEIGQRRDDIEQKEVCHKAGGVKASN